MPAMKPRSAAPEKQKSNPKRSAAFRVRRRRKQNRHKRSRTISFTIPGPLKKRRSKLNPQVPIRPEQIAGPIPRLQFSGGWARRSVESMNASPNTASKPRMPVNRPYIYFFPPLFRPTNASSRRTFNNLEPSKYSMGALRNQWTVQGVTRASHIAAMSSPPRPRPLCILPAANRAHADGLQFIATWLAPATSNLNCA